MVCFFTCFGSSKKPQSSCFPKDQNLSQSHEINEALLCSNQEVEEAEIVAPIEVIPEIKGNNEEQVNTSFRKKVIFDVFFKTSEECQAQEGSNSLVENEQKGKKREESKDGVVQAFLHSSDEKREENVQKGESKDEADSLSYSTISSLFTYPRDHRRQHCESSDDECVDMDFNKGNSVDDELDGKNDEMDSNCKGKNGSEDSAAFQEESSELFSISIGSTKQSSAVERDEKEVSSPLKPAPDREVNKHNARDRSQYVHSVLTPIANLGQWKAVRAKTASLLEYQEKENLNLVQEFTMPYTEKENFNLMQENAIPFSEEQPTLKQSQQQDSKRFSNRFKDDEVAVDTSLSSWLMESGKTPLNGNSPDSVGNSSSKRTKSTKSFEDRPILGVLAVEDLKQMSKAATPSPRRSPSHSPDEMPIIGTIGSYWKRAGEVMIADNCSSGKGTSGASGRKGGMNSQSTPFQARLEKALDGAMAQV